jgi:hypothetical protein
MRRALVLSLLLVLPGQLSADDKPIVAVFPIEAKGIKLKKGFLDRLTDYLGTSLAEDGGYQVIPSEDIKMRLLKEKKKSHKLKCDKKCKIDLARELAAQKTVSPQILKLGSKCTVAIRIYDLLKAATDSAASFSGGCEVDEIVASLEKAVEKLVGGAPVKKDTSAKKEEKAPAEEAKAGINWIHSKPTGIDFTKSEITVDQFRTCVEAGKCKEPSSKSDDEWCNWGYDDRGNHPINCVDWNKANSFCEWAGGRLPTEEEWHAEASNKGSRKHPWGDAEVTCDYAIWGDGERTDGCGKNSTWPVCSKAKGNSVSGLCDISGNLWELTSSWYDKDHKYRVVRGGSWRLGHPEYLQASSRLMFTPGYWSRDNGFRCVRADSPY